VNAIAYEPWLKEVEEALASLNMPMSDWQKSWAFDFRREFAAGTTANDAAMKANRYWCGCIRTRLSMLNAPGLVPAGCHEITRVGANYVCEERRRDGEI